MKKLLFPLESNRNSLFLLLVLIAYSCVAAVGMYHHEMWRDELDPWLNASSNASFADFVRTMSKGTNPYGWYLILFFLSKITLNPYIIQVAHLAVAVLAVYLLLRFSPFSLLQKLLLCLGYYLLFEYGIISRGYALTVFCLFLFCLLYTKFPKNGILHSVPIFLLANATAGLGIVLSVAFILFLAAEYFWREEPVGKGERTIKYRGWALCLGIASVWIAMQSVSPPPDSVFADQLFLKFDSARAMNVLRNVWAGYVPMPDPTSEHFWNTNISAAAGSGGFARIFLTVSSLFFIGYGILYFSKRKSVLLFFLAGTLGVLCFSYFSNIIYFINAVRYHGFVFLVFVVSCWLLNSSPELKGSGVRMFSSLREKLGMEKHAGAYLLFLCGINAGAGVFAFSKDLVNEFSAVERTGKYIVENNLQKYPMTGFVDFAISPISAFTRKPIYFPERDTVGTFPLWTKAKFTSDQEQIKRRLTGFIEKQKDSVLVVLNFDLNAKRMGNVSFKYLQSFKGSIVLDENYSLYLASVDRMPETKSGLLHEMERSENREEAYFLLAKMYFQEQNIDSSLYFLKRVVDLNPGNIDALNSMGVLYFKHKMDYTSAEHAWSKVLSIDSKYYQMYVNLMMNCQAKNDENCLLNWLRAALSAGMTLEEIRSKGILLTDQQAAKVNQ